MTRSLPFALIAGAALLSGTAAFAATTPPTKTATKTVATKTTTTHAVARTTAPMTAGHMVTTKTKTGKTITYNCSKAGNANKAACKK